MAVRESKVEIRFDPAGFWIDVSAWALHSDISVQSGRDNEAGDPVPVGTATVRLVNDDGRFSPDLPSSAYYPNVVAGRFIRLSVKIGASWYVRHYGTIQSWVVTWPDGDQTGLHATTTVNSSDVFGSLPSYTLRDAASEVLRSRENLAHHWALRDTESPVLPTAGTVTLTTPGTLGWAAGGLLPMDEGDAQHVQLRAGASGITLTSGALNIAPPYRILLVIMDSPAADTTVISSLPGGHSIRYINGAGFDIFPEQPGEVDPYSYPCLLSLTVPDTGVATLDVLDETGFGGFTSLGITLGTLRKIVLNPTLSGGAIYGAAHLAIAQGLGPDVYTTARWLLGPRLPGTSDSDVLSQLLDFANAGLTVSGLDPDEAIIPPLAGRDLADVLGSVVKGLGGRLRDNRDGTLTWVPFADSTTAIALPAGEVDTSMTWQTDDTSWLSDCTVTWPDGTSYTASRPDGKRKSDTIEPVHPTTEGDKAYADWLVWTGSSGARLPAAPFDASTLSDADAVTLASAKVGSRVTLSNLPQQMPSTLTCTVEGIDETIAANDWTMTFKLSPDVYSRLFILDDPVQGVLDSDYILAP